MICSLCVCLEMHALYFLIHKDVHALYKILYVFWYDDFGNLYYV